MQNYIEINTESVNLDNIKESIYENRKALSLCDVRNYKSKVTIWFIAYNNIEKTKRSINSILENTKDIDYDILLIDNGSTDGTLEFFKTTSFKKKTIIRITENKGASFPACLLGMNLFSQYLVVVLNDIIVTPNWLSNLLKVAESDSKIGMICPMSSNTSNYQDPMIDISCYEDIPKKAVEFNRTDARKWKERLRLMTLVTLYTKECLFATGWPNGDMGFAHNFADDDITFRVRRAGYKAVLACDTWVYHDHVNNNLTPEKIQKINNDLAIGRRNFREKYFGLDAWDDVNNFIPEILPQIKPPVDKENCTILGIDVRCGTPILEIKNHLRQYDIFAAECCAVTSEGKYFIDLQTVCGADNVVACSPTDASEQFKQEVFDYIIIGENVNEYPELFRIIRHVYSLLKKGGQMFVYLKNNYDIYAFLNVIGHRQVRPTKASLNLTIEQFLEQLLNMDINAEVAGVVPYTNVPEEYINEVNNRTAAFVQDEWSETAARLTADRFIVKIER